MARRTFSLGCAMLVASALACGCEGAVEPAAASATGALTVQPDSFMTYVYGNSMGHVDEYLRFNGAILYPRNEAVVVTIDPDPGLPSTRRIQVHYVDMDPSRPTYGDVVLSDALAWRGFSPDLRGFTATSFRDGAGNVDGLMIAADQDPAGDTLYAVTVDGDSGVARYNLGKVLGLDPGFVGSVVPGVESAQDEQSSRVFLAHVVDEGDGDYQIHVGFATRIDAYQWWFQKTSEIDTGGVFLAPSGEGEFDRTDCLPVYNLSVAYDINRDEFTVGWECSAFTSILRRFDGSGIPVASVNWYAMDAPEGLHSGTGLAYNRDSSRYYFFFQHNSSTVTPNASGTFDCTPSSLLGCVSTDPGFLDRTKQWTVTVDYSQDYEFRAAGRTTEIACPSNMQEGAEYRLPVGSEAVDCAVSPVWDFEDVIYAAYPPNTISLVHSFVNAPELGNTLIIHPTCTYGLSNAQVRYSITEYVSPYPFDQ